MKPHKIHISPRSITLAIETLESGLQRVRLTVYADYIQLDEDARPGLNTPELSLELEQA